MARARNDGRGRLGGRAKGTPNKATSTLKDWIVEVVDSNRGQIIKDLSKVAPLERLKILEKLIGYVVAKPTTQPPELSHNYDKYGELRIGYDDYDDD
jgi:hypothetical protein